MKTYAISPDTRSFLENIPIPLAVYQYVDDQIRALLVSKAYLKLFGYDSGQEAVYGLGTNLYRNVHPEDIARMEKYAYNFATQEDGYDILFRNKREDQSKYHIIHATGRHISVDGVNLAFITYTDETAGTGNDSIVKAVLTDMSDQFAASDSTEFAKHYDALTGLQNMPRFLDQSMAGIEKIWAQGGEPVILYFNLRHLKQYNSRYGFKAGDQQICTLAECIAAVFGRERASRFESDHFVVYALKDQVESKLTTLFSQMAAQGENNLPVKVGIFKFEKDGTRLTDACDKARLACESVMSTPVSTFVWFDDNIQKQNTLKFYIIRNFEKAMEKGWIQVWYQPVVRTMIQTVCSAEALVRWIDPEYGMISPGQFVPILEETGQIYKMDLYVFEQACRDYKHLVKKGDDAIPVSVNLSRKDFLHDDLPEIIDGISRKYGVPREFTNLEITESAFVKNIDKVAPSIKRFHELGYKVLMDDFGTGYSSLGVLKNYAFDELKLDMSFLKDFDEKAKTIITAIVNMAKALNLSTLAEGVETKKQFLFLREIGCEKIQGYYFSKPMPIEELAPYFESRGLAVEPTKWRAYFTKLSRTVYPTDAPLCLVDDDGVKMKILFANQAYKAVLSRDHVTDLEDWERKLNTPGDPIHIFHRQYADQQLRKLSGPQTTAYPSGDHYMQLTGTVAVRQGDHYLYSMQIQYVAIDVKNMQQVQFETMSDLYYLCNDIAIYDLAHNTVEGVKSSLSDQPMGVGVKLKDLASVINAWTKNYCYLPDQERFAAFMEVSTLKSRMEQNASHALTGLFRSITASGAYRWMLHMIAPVQRSDYNRALHVTFDAGLAEADLVKLVPALSGAIADQKRGEIPTEVLWRNMILNSKRMIFWKDDQRRFLGASRSFLNYFGLHDESEIIGKTDEDMGWHIDPKPFKKDEEAVLKTGKKCYMRRGKCIVNGTNRAIVASKIPVYRDGKIVGLLGNVTDADATQKFLNREKVLTSVDPVTGLANTRGVSDGVYAYLCERWHSGIDFAIMEVTVPEYDEIVKLYGKSSGDALLKNVGAALRDCAGTGCVIGRAQGNLFFVVMDFDTKEDVRNVARKIRAAVESMRQAGQWSGNCSVKINVSYSDASSKDRSAYIGGLSGMILNSKDCETL